jgi:hypothetical protein
VSRPSLTLAPAAVVAVFCLAFGVSCSPKETKAMGSGHDPAKAAAVAGSACERKLLTAADAATVIAGPITGTRPLAGDRGACEFTTAGYASVIVSLRPNGKATLAVWKSGRMPVSGTPLAGVGDDAVWVGSLDEVVAERNDLLCDIQVNGFAAVLHDRSAAAEQKAVGALCNRIFEEVR